MRSIINTCLANSVFPIPEEPRKRKTRGCSSSIQPPSFLRIAVQDVENRSKIYEFYSTTVIFLNKLWYGYLLSKKNYKLGL